MGIIRQFEKDPGWSSYCDIDRFKSEGSWHLYKLIDGEWFTLGDFSQGRAKDGAVGEK